MFPKGCGANCLDVASRQIGILVYAALFLPEHQVDLIDLLRSKAAGGRRVRVMVGDPKSPKLLERGAEERFGTGISSRAQVALLHYAPLQGAPGVEVHTHRTTLYNSLYSSTTSCWSTRTFAA